MNTRQAYAEGFVKRAMEYGFSQQRALELYKQSAEYPRSFQDMVSTGGFGPYQPYQPSSLPKEFTHHIGRPRERISTTNNPTLVGVGLPYNQPSPKLFPSLNNPTPVGINPPRDNQPLPKLIENTPSLPARPAATPPAPTPTHTVPSGPYGFPNRPTPKYIEPSGPYGVPEPQKCPTCGK
jgi:hypothetical protein